MEPAEHKDFVSKLLQLPEEQLRELWQGRRKRRLSLQESGGGECKLSVEVELEGLSTRLAETYSLEICDTCHGEIT